MKPVLFILRVYNDADHIVPIIWKMVRSGRPVRVIFVDKNANIDIHKERLFRLLTAESGCSVEYFYALPGPPLRLPNRLLVPPDNPVLIKCLRIFFSACLRWVWTDSWADRVIGKIDPALVAVDSHGPNQVSIEGKLLHAAKRRGAPVICLPHGPNVYINFDHADPRVCKPLRHVLQRYPQYAFYDRAYFSSAPEAEAFFKQNPEVPQVASLGVPRFCREWTDLLRRDEPEYVPRKDTGKRLKVAFLMPHWVYTDKPAILAAIKRIASMDSVFLVVKEHTREGAGSLPDEDRARYHEAPNVEVVRSSPSVSLAEWVSNGFRSREQQTASSSQIVKWSDVVISFGSGIAIEAVTQNRLLINPIYLFSYATVFETFGVCLAPRNEDELIEMIGRCVNKPVQMPYSTEQFYRQIICAGGPEDSVLSDYCEDILSLVSDRPSN